MYYRIRRFIDRYRYHKIKQKIGYRKYRSVLDNIKDVLADTGLYTDIGMWEYGKKVNEVELEVRTKKGKVANIIVDWYRGSYWITYRGTYGNTTELSQKLFKGENRQRLIGLFKRYEEQDKEIRQTINQLLGGVTMGGVVVYWKDDGIMYRIPVVLNGRGICLYHEELGLEVVKVFGVRGEEAHIKSTKDNREKIIRAVTKVCGKSGDIEIEDVIRRDAGGEVVLINIIIRQGK